MVTQIRLILATFALLLVTKISAAGLSNDIKDEWQRWPVVGQATLSWFWLDIYSSQLRSPDGEYAQGSDITPHPVALEIHYMRDISSVQLLEATEEQWQNQGYSKEQIGRWVALLAEIFPSVKMGEILVYVTDGRAGKFVYTPNGREPQEVGYITDEQLNDAFLAIWLSAKTEYPKLRLQLIGMNR